ncbi:MAG: UvrD-helicase domain-containing protein [Oscillospiraceae bacterium]|nr:UvrD-helicase domain-containing protein [Oscillospiraceae bacterium]
MQVGIDELKNRVHISKASKDMNYYCPFCGASLQVRRGERNSEHFAHRRNEACNDSWSREYDMSDWHTDWQNRFPAINQEIKLTLGSVTHRADVMVGRTIIEFQHSRMNAEQFSNRNNFYMNFGNKVIWLFDFREDYKKGLIENDWEEDGGLIHFVWNKTRSAFKFTDVYRPDCEIFIQIGDDDLQIIRVFKVDGAGLQGFVTDRFYSVEEFLRFIKGNSDSFEEPHDYLEAEADYREFKEKYHIDLDPQQERAVMTVDGPFLLLAVPGSGKTTTLLNRLGYMTLQKGIAADTILCISFTIAAADEMRSRFASEFGDELASQIDFRTINSLAVSILSEYCKKKKTPLPALVDKKKSRQVIRRILGKYLDRKIYDKDIVDVMTRMSYAKNRLTEEEEQKNYYVIEDVNAFDFIKEYREGIQDSSGTRIIDFDDQLCYAKTILEKHSDILEYFQKKYRYICLDEAQDTSKIQFEIINLISSDHKNLFMVGDDDQSIYGFRGAYPQEIYSFRVNYPNPTIKYLENNYRSFREITNIADSFIADTRVFPKTIHSVKGEGGAVNLININNWKDQFPWVTDYIRNNTDKSIGILYRENSSAIPLVALCKRAGIPFTLLGGNEFFFESWPVLNIFDALRMVKNPYDVQLFKKTAKTFFSGIEEKKRDYWIPRLIREKHMTMFEAVYDQYKMYGGSEYNKASRYYRVFSRVSDNAAECLRILKNSDYDYAFGGDLFFDTLLYLAEEGQTIGEYMNSIEQFKEYLSAKIDNNRNVCLSTIHSAKGLEFDVVVLVDAIEGMFPSTHEVDSSDYDEEKRIFYVGLTRAKQELNVFNIKDIASPFVDELISRKTWYTLK